MSLLSECSAVIVEGILFIGLAYLRGYVLIQRPFLLIKKRFAINDRTELLILNENAVFHMVMTCNGNG